MNLLRAAVAPLAEGGRFFGSVVVSGSHLRSVEMVASGEADVASIDCVSFAHFQRLYPSLVSGVRVLTLDGFEPQLALHHCRLSKRRDGSGAASCSSRRV